LAATALSRLWGYLAYGLFNLDDDSVFPDATTLIETGDEITVDGYLGIVTLGDSRL
jgi:hypothetical protein